MRWGPSVLRACSLIALASIAACDRGPDPAWIEARLAEAHARDRAARTTHAGDDERAAWTLVVVAPDGTSDTMPFHELMEMPRTEVATSDPDDLGSRQLLRYSGVRLSELVRNAPGAEQASDVTLLASDGFRATIDMDDVRLFPILLAMDANGAPLERDHGGPLYSVLPFSSHPELTQRYTSSAFVFYVTHLMIGTAAPALRVGDHALHAADLAALPQASITVEVGYRSGWPSEATLLHGVRVRDVLALAGHAAADEDRIRVFSRALITHGDERPTIVRGADVRTEDVLLALAYGETREPIPSSLGGPITLAFPDAVAAHLSDHDWLTFVDEIAVEHPR